MPPAPKKPLTTTKTTYRPPISNSSLVFVPLDALEGYQERLEKCVKWNLTGGSIRHHHDKGDRPDLPRVTFTEAFEDCIRRSYISGFFNNDSDMTLPQQWEYLNIIMFDANNAPNEEAKICFNNNNSITNNSTGFLKYNLITVTDDKNELRRRFYEINTLRLIWAQMTTLDARIQQFSKLTTLNLSGNFLKNFESSLLPRTLLFLELECNMLSSICDWVANLPPNLLYLGLSKNLFTDETLVYFFELPPHLSTLDLSDNDICALDMVIESLSNAKELRSLMLHGNPCSLCAAYPRLTLNRLKELKWLDSRQVAPTDNLIENVEVHPDDLRSSYFSFSVFRVISVLPPPKVEKGIVASYHIEIEIPLLDSFRRQFLFFHRTESLDQLLPEPEDATPSETIKDETKSIDAMQSTEEATVETCVYDHLVQKNPNAIRNYTIFESNHIVWNKIMLFQDPVVKIFCPDLKALRDVFRSIIRVRLVFTMVAAKEPVKKKTSQTNQSQPKLDQEVDIFDINCSLKNLDWSQPFQHFHWDETLESADAIHWGEGDLSIVQYISAVTKPTKGKAEPDAINATKQSVPEVMTCHLGFSVEMLNTADPQAKTK